MRTGLKVALLLGTVGVSAAFAGAGCESLPDSGSVTHCWAPEDNPAPVKDECGVFVSAAGNDGNAGTKARPVRTISKAVEIWSNLGRGGAVIYLCGEELDEPEGATVPGSALTLVIGGLDCNAEGENKWVYVTGDPARETVLTAPAGKVPLRLSGDGGVYIKNVHVVAKTVPDAMPGVSSIAVIAEQVTAVFDRTTLEARDGAPGAMSEPDSMAAQAGAAGNMGKSACDSEAIMETTAPINTCTMEVSSGGVGGVGGTSLSGNGLPGVPSGSSNVGGSGQTAMMATCTNGGDGAPGATGDVGTNASGLGTLDPKTGYIGVAGGDGKPGTIGQGGGGGGGTCSKPGATNLCGTGPGASGGSGGSGGCGGAGGRGGGAAGSSIGVVSLNSTLHFYDASRILVGSGGAPGVGGDGQAGGAGQAGGTGGAAMNGVAGGCNGGKGGDGGNGGKGGKGLGGHAIGIAFTVQAPPKAPDFDSEVKIDITGEPGAGAVKADTQEFEPEDGSSN